MEVVSSIEIGKTGAGWNVRIGHGTRSEVWGPYADQFNATIMLPEAAKLLQQMVTERAAA